MSETHPYETTGRIRICPVCGVRQYLSGASPLHGITREWLPADVKACSAPVARTSKPRATKAANAKEPPPRKWRTSPALARMIACLATDGAATSLAVAQRTGLPAKVVNNALSHGARAGRLRVVGTIPRNGEIGGRGQSIYAAPERL